MPPPTHQWTPRVGDDVDSFASSLFLVSITTLKWAAKYAGVFAEISGIGAEFDVYTYEEGGANDVIWKLPKTIKYPNLVLKRGITDDTTLEEWIYEFKVKGERAEVTISLLNDMGSKPQERWHFYDCWPVKWTGPTLSATQNQVAQETLEIAHHGSKSRM